MRRLLPAALVVGFAVAPGTPQQAAALVASDTARYGEAIRRAGVVLE